MNVQIDVDNPVLAVIFPVAGWTVRMKIDLDDSECKDPALAQRMSDGTRDKVAEVVPGFIASGVVDVLQKRITEIAADSSQNNQGFGAVESIEVRAPGILTFSCTAKSDPNPSASSNPHKHVVEVVNDHITPGHLAN